MSFWKKLLIGGILLLGILGVLGKLGKEGKEGEDKGKATETKIAKFAVMGDIHEDYINFEKALLKAKENGAEFIIIDGDLTTVGEQKQLQKIKDYLDKNGLSYYVIPGNHDIWLGRKVKDDIFSDIFGSSYQSFKIEGVKLILIDNGDTINGLNRFDGRDQEVWLKRELEECLQIYCVVFSHIPFEHPTSTYIMGDDSDKVASQAARLKETFKADNVNTFYAGHLHFSSEYEIEGRKTTIVGAVASERNFQSPKFMEISITNKAGVISVKNTEVFIDDSISQ